MIYDVVKKLAKNNNISISSLEKELSLSNGMISKWNKSIPSADVLAKVAKRLGTTSESILAESSKEVR